MDYRFRGWDVIGQKWVFGDLTHNQKVTQTGLEPRTMVGGYEVDPESVGQYAGVCDKKGNEIYKGDILYIKDTEGDNSGVNEVKFRYGVFGVENWTEDHLTSLSFFTRTEYELEIIGNVYQNKELLENDFACEYMRYFSKL